MDFDDHVKHMTQKYKIATAIAVIKNKPPDLSINQYVLKLQEKLKKIDEDFDDLVCSDDFSEVFNIDDVLTNLEDDNNSLDLLQDLNNSICDIQEVNHINNKDITREVIQQSNVSVNKNLMTTSSEKTLEESTVTDILKIFQDIDGDKDTQKTNLGQSSYSESSQIISRPHANIGENQTMMVCVNDDLVHDDEIDLSNILDEYSEITYGKDDRIAANIAKNINKPFINRNNNAKNDITAETYDISKQNKQSDNIIILNDTLFENNTLNIKISTKNDKAEKIARNIDKSIAHISKNNVNNAKSNQIQDVILNNDNSVNVTTINSKELNIQDSQDTIFYTVHGFTQNNSQISQSQYQNINIPSKFIIGTKNKQNIPIESVNNSKTIVESRNIEYIIDKDGKMYNVLQTMELDNVSQKQPELKNNINNFDEIMDGTNESNLDIVQNMDCDETNATQKQNISQKTTENNQMSLELTQLEQEMEQNNSQLIPFKVVKELSRVKVYLDKNEGRMSVDGYSTDSGYRSDSQHSSYKTHLSDNWLHQSAYCLYTYIVQCPLVANTQEIVTEISQVLGRLVDKMHEEEKYPKFLEDILSKVDDLLRDLYEGSESGDNILLIKDEKIQRLFLLNKSAHILKYTIDKIIVLLQEAHKFLTAKDILYELSNVGAVENLCYVFYVLEISIQKYLKVKDIFSQNTQNSQKTLKKSSITDIWRKKWNFCKEPNITESQEKICILTKCAEILNKIIVDCMDGYSLVSYAALQCFNLLQS